MRRRFFISVLVTIFTIAMFGTHAYAQQMQPEHFKTKKQCLSCHGKTTLSTTRDNKKISLYVDVYQLQGSVHSDYDCNVCHQFQEEHLYGKALTDKVSDKCGNCHTGAAFEYNRSIHSGEGKKPNCVSCHGGHSITHVGDYKSSLAGTNIAKTCAKQCHTIQYEQYVESFHGKAAALGAQNAPKCSDCHGSHKILSKTNPIDKTHANNKKFLCAKCHEGDILGAGTIEHYETKPEGYGKPMYYVKTKMPWLIIVVMSIFLIHIILDLLHRIRLRLSSR